MKKGMEMLVSAGTNEVGFVVDLTKEVTARFYVTFFKSQLFDCLVFTANVKGLSSSDNCGKVKVVEREAIETGGVNGAMFTFEGQGIYVMVETNVHNDANSISVSWSDNFDDLL